MDDDPPQVDPEVQAALSAALHADLLTAPDRHGEHLLEDEDAAPVVRAKPTVCEVCGEAPPKYTCPRCQCVSCGLSCVKRHKEERSCSGLPDVTEMVPLGKFTDKQLERDFRFVESCRRVVDTAHRCLPNIGFRFSFRALPPPLHALREAARRRGVLCQITSEGMAKRDANTSRFDRRRDTIVWRVEFVFHPTGRRDPSRDFSVATDWANERFNIGDLLRHAWQSNPALASHNIQRGYNKAGAWIEGQNATKRPREGEEAGAGAHGEAPSAEEPNAGGPEEAAPETTVITLDDDEDPIAALHASPGGPDAGPSSPTVAVPKAEPEAAAAAVLTAPDDAAPPAAAPAAPSAPVTVPMPAPARPAESVEDRAVHARPPTAEELEDKARIDRFLALGPHPALLVQAERLGTTRAFFPLDERETLHQGLRRVFFINEFPVVHVVPRWSFADDAPGDEKDAAEEDPLGVPTKRNPEFPIIDDEQKTQLRDGFRKKDRRPTGMPPPGGEGEGADGPKPEGEGEERRRGPLTASQLTDAEREKLIRIPCRGFRRGRCQAPEGDCPYWHCSEAELPACRSMVANLQCPLGPRCSFSHDEALIMQERRNRRNTPQDGPGGRGRGANPMGAAMGYGRGGGSRGRGDGRGRGAAPPMPSHAAPLRGGIHVSMGAGEAALPLPQAGQQGLPPQEQPHGHPQGQPQGHGHHAHHQEHRPMHHAPHHGVHEQRDRDYHQQQHHHHHHHHHNQQHHHHHHHHERREYGGPRNEYRPAPRDMHDGPPQHYRDDRRDDRHNDRRDDRRDWEDRRDYRRDDRRDDFQGPRGRGRGGRYQPVEPGSRYVLPPQPQEAPVPQWQRDVEEANRR